MQSVNRKNEKQWGFETIMTHNNKQFVYRERQLFAFLCSTICTENKSLLVIIDKPI